MEWMLGSPALAVSYRWQAGGLPSCSTAAAVGSGVLELPTLAVLAQAHTGQGSYPVRNLGNFIAALQLHSKGRFATSSSR